MPSFSQKSLDKLHTCHPDIIRVMEIAIKHYDFTILYGTRSMEEQFSLFKQGRKLQNGKWVKIGATVTNIDGVTKLSMHNHNPSLAVDCAPYPIDWNDLKRFKDMAEVIKQAAVTVGVSLQWGGDWIKFVDYPHFEIKGVK